MALSRRILFFADTGKEVLCGNSDTTKNTEQYGRFTNAWRLLYWQNDLTAVIAKTFE